MFKPDVQTAVQSDDHFSKQPGSEEDGEVKKHLVSPSKVLPYRNVSGHVYNSKSSEEMILVPSNITEISSSSSNISARSLKRSDLGTQIYESTQLPTSNETHISPVTLFTPLAPAHAINSLRTNNYDYGKISTKTSKETTMSETNNAKESLLNINLEGVTSKDFPANYVLHQERKESLALTNQKELDKKKFPESSDAKNGLKRRENIDKLIETAEDEADIRREAESKRLEEEASLKLIQELLEVEEKEVQERNRIIQLDEVWARQIHLSLEEDERRLHEQDVIKQKQKDLIEAKKAAAQEKARVEILTSNKVEEKTKYNVERQGHGTSNLMIMANMEANVKEKNEVQLRTEETKNKRLTTEEVRKIRAEMKRKIKADVDKKMKEEFEERKARMRWSRETLAITHVETLAITHLETLAITNIETLAITDYQEIEKEKEREIKKEQEKEKVRLQEEEKEKKKILAEEDRRNRAEINRILRADADENMRNEFEERKARMKEREKEEKEKQEKEKVRLQEEETEKRKIRAEEDRKQRADINRKIRADADKKISDELKERKVRLQEEETEKQKILAEEDRKNRAEINRLLRADEDKKRRDELEERKARMKEKEREGKKEQEQEKEEVRLQEEETEKRKILAEEDRKKRAHADKKIRDQLEERKARMKQNVRLLEQHTSKRRPMEEKEKTDIIMNKVAEEKEKEIAGLDAEEYRKTRAEINRKIRAEVDKKIKDELEEREKKMRTQVNMEKIVDNKDETKVDAKSPVQDTQVDECYICMDDEDTTIRMECGHIVHLECAKSFIASSCARAGGIINTNAARCGYCRRWMSHPTLDASVSPLRSLYDKIAVMGLHQSALEAGPNQRVVRKPLVARRERSNSVDVDVDEVLKDFVYYLCAKCKNPYYGGRRQCINHAAVENAVDVAKDRVCAMCADATHTRESKCSKKEHGVGYIEYKCRYCCNVATFFCSGTTHFCDSCHTNSGFNKLIPCPGPPQCTGQHPPNDGQEYCLGCALCRDPSTH